MVYRTYTIHFRNEDDAALIDALPDGEKNGTIIELIREYVRKEAHDNSRKQLPQG